MIAKHRRFWDHGRAKEQDESNLCRIDEVTHKAVGLKADCTSNGSLGLTLLSTLSKRITQKEATRR